MVKRRKPPSRRPKYKQADPPPPGVRHTERRKGPRQAFVAMLKENPGVWFQYEPGRSHSASSTSSWKADFPGLTVTSRLRPDGGADLYMQWPDPNAPELVQTQPGYEDEPPEPRPPRPEPPPDDFNWSDFQ